MTDASAKHPPMELWIERQDGGDVWTGDKISKLFLLKSGNLTNKDYDDLKAIVLEASKGGDKAIHATEGRDGTVEYKYGNVTTGPNVFLNTLYYAAWADAPLTDDYTGSRLKGARNIPLSSNGNENYLGIERIDNFDIARVSASGIFHFVKIRLIYNEPAVTSGFDEKKESWNQSDVHPASIPATLTRASSTGGVPTLSRMSTISRTGGADQRTFDAYDALKESPYDQKLQSQLIDAIARGSVTPGGADTAWIVISTFMDDPTIRAPAEDRLLILREIVSSLSKSTPQIVEYLRSQEPSLMARVEQMETKSDTRQYSPTRDTMLGTVSAAGDESNDVLSRGSAMMGERDGKIYLVLRGPQSGKSYIVYRDGLGSYTGVSEVTPELTSRLQAAGYINVVGASPFIRGGQSAGSPIAFTQAVPAVAVMRTSQRSPVTQGFAVPDVAQPLESAEPEIVIEAKRTRWDGVAKYLDRKGAEGKVWTPGARPTFASRIDGTNTYWRRDYRGAPVERLRGTPDELRAFVNGYTLVDGR